MDKNIYNFGDRLLELAKKKRVRVAIGLLESNPEIEEYLKKAAEFAEIVVVGAKVDGYENYVFSEHEEVGKKLLELADSKKVDAISKGQLHPKYLYKPVLERMGLPIAYFDGSKNLYPCIFQNTKTKRFFILCGGDLWSGFNIEQKKYESLNIANYLKSCGIEPKIGVMSMRRAVPKDAKPIPGFEPNPVIEENFALDEQALAFLREQGFDAEIYYIEYETALDAGVNMILSPIGPVGNAVGRILNFFTSEWEMIGVPALHVRPLVVEDTFKTGIPKNWYNHIISAAASVNSMDEEK